MKFIVIDGLDASGKDTQAIRLFNFLRNNRKTVCLRIHPAGDNFFGTNAKRFLLSKGKSAHFASALFYMMDVIRSILYYAWRKYDYIVFVRYLMGTAYLPSPIHKIAYWFFACIVPKSNAMFFLDVNPKEAYRRIRERHQIQEMFEDVSELGKVRAKALSLALADKWAIINADQSLEKVQLEIRRRLSRRPPAASIDMPENDY